MKLLVIQHTAAEGPGLVQDWAFDQNIHLDFWHIYQNQVAPDHAQYSGVVVLGGTMNVDQEKEFPWLQLEKQWIRDYLKTQKPYLGLCFGAQLLAQVLGGQVVPNFAKEVGWHPIQKRHFSSRAMKNLFDQWPEYFSACQWHEDIFTLPPYCESLMTNMVSEHQVFSYQDFAIGFQFHPEAKPDWIMKSAENIQKFVAPITTSTGHVAAQPNLTFVQSKEVIALQTEQKHLLMKAMFFDFLNKFFINRKL